MSTKIYVENWGWTDAEFNAERGALSSRELDFAMQKLKDERNTANRELNAANRELDAARESIAELEAELERAKAAQRAERSAGQALFELFRAPFSDLIDERVSGLNLDVEEMRADIRRGVAALNLDVEEVRNDVERLQAQFDDAEPVDATDVENMIESALDEFVSQLTITR